MKDKNAATDKYLDTMTTIKDAMIFVLDNMPPDIIEKFAKKNPEEFAKIKKLAGR